MATKITPPPTSPFTGVASEIEPSVYFVIRKFFDLNSARSSQLSIAMANGIEWALKNPGKYGDQIPGEFEDAIRAAVSSYSNRCRDVKSDDALAALLGVITASIKIGARIKEKANG